jgi:hypothetical protein
MSKFMDLLSLNVTSVVCGLTAGTSVSGSYNTVVGPGAASSLTNGTYNVVLGPNANVGSTVSYATAIGPDTSITANYSMAIGRGTTVTIANRCAIGCSAYPLLLEFFGRGFMQYTYNTPFTSGSSHNISATQFLDGFLEWQPATHTSSTFVLPSASSILSAIGNAQINMMTYGYLGAFIDDSLDTVLYVTAGSGMDYQGPTSLRDGESTIYVMIVTDTSPAAVRVLSLYD